MPGTSSAKTRFALLPGHDGCNSGVKTAHLGYASRIGHKHFRVMAGRGDEALLRADVPAIHVLGRGNKARTWMPGTSPGMTISGAWKYESALLPGHD
jgi:hypothetical protein